MEKQPESVPNWQRAATDTTTRGMADFSSGVVPRIYVACLAAYNAGILHGRWIDADDVDDMEAATRAMLKASPIPDAEEWAIHDHEGLGRHISEFSSFQTCADISEYISDMERQGGEAWAMDLLDYYAGDVDDARKAADEYAGTYESPEEFGESYSDCLNIEESVMPYFDFEQFGRDLMYDYIILETGGRGFHAFRYW